MKSFRILSLIAMMALAQMSAFANDGNPVTDRSKVYVKKANKEQTLSLRLVNLEKIATAITLKDTRNEVLFTKKVKNEVGTALKLDFSRLPRGNYKLFINRTQKSYVQALSIENGSLVIGEMVEVYKPIIKKTKNGFSVFTAGKDIKSVSILTNKDEVVYEKTYTNSEATSYKFSMKDVPAGEYTVKVETAFDIYYKRVQLK